MKFLVLLLLVGVEKFTGWRRYLQRDAGYLRLLAWTESRSPLKGRAWLQVLLLVGLPLLLLAALLAGLRPLLHGWLLLPLHLLVLLYSLGRITLPEQLGSFRDAWRRGDLEAAERVAERDLGVTAESPEQLLHAVRGYLLWQGFQGFFAVIFWYALLGPLAALGYRLLVLLRGHAQPATADAAGQLLHALDWLPVRLLALSFALVGNFIGVSRALLDDLLHWPTPAAQLLERAGNASAEPLEGSAGQDGCTLLDAHWQLLVRSALLWYVLLALQQLF